MGLRGPGARGGKTRTEDVAYLWPPYTPWLKEGLTRAERVIAFIEELPITKGILADTQMKLEEFQLEFIREIYDRLTPEGRRVVRQALLSIARKNGKTGLIVGIALAHLVGPEAENRGEIGSAANDREQAALVFDEIEAIIERVPWIESITNVQRFKKLIEVTGDPPGGKGRGSVYEALSSDAKTKHGASPSLWIYDELAQSLKRELLDTLQTSQGGRAEPLGIVISTQSALASHPMSELVDYAENVNAGTIDDPTFVGRVYASPEGCDLMDREAWQASNPALGIFRDETDLETLARRAQRMPSFESAFRNLYLNQRVDAVERAINRADWEACRELVELEELLGLKCYGSLDLGSVSDLCAFSLVWPQMMASWTWQWVPKERIRERVERDRVTYDVWERAGDIIATPGRARDTKAIMRKVIWACDKFDVQAIAYDRWRIEDLIKDLDDDGIGVRNLDDWDPAERRWKRSGDGLPLIPHGQGFKEMAPAFDHFETALMEHLLKHGGNPVMRWQASNLIVEKDDAGNRKPSKRRSSDKIDGIVSLIMAVGLAMSVKPEVEEKSFWEVAS